jgi:glycosyltransferase involved in cell wall biosynthesis
MTSTSPRIVVVYDRSVISGSDSHVLAGLHAAFPTATLYRSPIIKSRITMAIHRLFPKQQINWFKDLDLSSFDIIISYGNKAKHIGKTRDRQLHIHYAHSTAIEPALQNIDIQAAQSIDVFIAASIEAQQIIKARYDRPATIVNPPIDIALFEPARERDNYYVVIDNQLPNSHINLVTDSASKLGIRLRILTPSDSETTLRTALTSAKGYISLHAVDFDTIQVEALAAGAFIVAYSPYTYTDIVQDSETGVLFQELNTEAVTTALKTAEIRASLPGTLRRKAKRFDIGLFCTKLRKIVHDISA